MIYTKPDYYDSFKCIADKCEDTCCAGWQIVIDKESLEKYKKIKGDYIWQVMARVDWETGTFRQDKEKRCAFLNENNLCDLYTNAGEHTLCKTCREYPRHTEEFEGVREITLSISCPEVAKLLMDRKTPVEYISTETNEPEKEEFENFDPFLFSIIEDARVAMLEILQNRELPLKVRTILVLGMAHDMQGRINRQEMFSCFEVIEKYKKQKAIDFARNYLKKTATMELEEEKLKEWFAKLYELELLRDEWDAVLEETGALVFHNEKGGYHKLRQEFEDWKWARPDMDIHLEQIIVYFLFTYFPGSVYDGELFAKVQMAVYSTWMIETIWMGRWLLNDRQLEKEEMTELLYRFSREVEHSDDNLKKLDKIMEKKWLL